MDVFLNGSFTQCDAQLDEFTPDTLGVPKKILPDHSAKNGKDIRGYSRFLPPIHGFIMTE
jgi:hypothetical protein